MDTEELRRLVDGMEAQCVHSIRAQLARAVEVLQWYAGPAWKSQPSTASRGGQQIHAPIDQDLGQRAREALRELGHEVKPAADPEGPTT